MLRRCPILSESDQHVISTALAAKGQEAPQLVSNACEVVRQYTENNQFEFFPYDEAAKIIPQVERGFFKSKKSPFIEILKTKEKTPFCSSKDELEEYVEFTVSNTVRKS